MKKQFIIVGMLVALVVCFLPTTLRAEEPEGMSVGFRWGANVLVSLESNPNQWVKLESTSGEETVSSTSLQMVETPSYPEVPRGTIGTQTVEAFPARGGRISSTWTGPTCNGMFVGISHNTFGTTIGLENGMNEAVYYRLFPSSQWYRLEAGTVDNPRFTTTISGSLEVTTAGRLQSLDEPLVRLEWDLKWHEHQIFMPITIR